MTPEERQLVADLFARLAELERSPRDPDAERAMRDGLARAPNAVYALVQTTLLQDEALKTANDRIADLEDELEQARAQPQRERSFLDRSTAPSPGKWNTGEVLRGGAGSVPSVGSRDQPMGVPPGYGRDRGDSYRDDPRGGYGGSQGGGYGGPQSGGQGSPWGGGQGEPSRGGGGFLGAAAAAAAGAIGGSLLLGGIRSALGGSQGGEGKGGEGKGPFSGAFDHLTGNKSSGGGSGGSGDLAREAGVGDIGKGGGLGAGNFDNDRTDRFGVANTKSENFDADDSALDDGSMEEDFADDAFDDNET